MPVPEDHQVNYKPHTAQPTTSQPAVGGFEKQRTNTASGVANSAVGKGKREIRAKTVRHPSDAPW